MKKQLKLASVLNIIINIFLFCIKIVVGFLYGSISMIADALNSLSDIIAAFLIYVCVKINNQKPDASHQFGHTRAENIAGYTTGVLMFILGFSIVKIAVERLVYHEVTTYSFYMILVIGITFVLKLGLYIYIKSILKKENSPALKANLQDHLNDIISILGVLVAVIGVRLGYYYLDSIIGIIIGIFILRGAYSITKENINFLMGVSAPKHLVDEIKADIMSIKAVENVHLIKSQYLGNKIQVEVHIELDKSMSLKQSHDIGIIVKEKIESLDDVTNCFVHIDPK